jgi:hypothetical protein
MREAHRQQARFPGLEVAVGVQCMGAVDEVCLAQDKAD